MANAEGGYDSRGYSWGTGQTRCYVEANVTSTSLTAMYISFSGKVRSGNNEGTAYRLSGYGVTCTVSTSAGGSCSASASYNYANWVAGCSGGVWVSRTHTSHNVTVTCSYSSYNGASNSGSVSVSIPITGQTHSIITCDANGGTGGPSKIDKWAGEDLSIPSDIPTRTNCRFDGWSEDSKATTPTYVAGKTYTGTDDKSYTLYAVWTQLYIYPTVKFVEGHRVDSPTSTQESALGTYARFEFSWNVDTTIYSDNLLSTYQATALLSDNSTPTCAITGTTSGTSGTVYISIPIATNLSGTVTFSVTDTAMEGEASGNGSVGIGHIPLEFSNGGTAAGILNSAGDAESITLGNLRLSDVHDDDLVTIPLKQLRWVVEEKIYMRFGKYYVGTLGAGKGTSFTVNPGCPNDNFVVLASVQCSETNWSWIHMSPAPDYTKTFLKINVWNDTNIYGMRTGSDVSNIYVAWLCIGVY